MSWECELCGSSDVPRAERFVEIGEVEMVAMACRRCGYPHTAEMAGGAHA